MLIKSYCLLRCSFPNKHTLSKVNTKAKAFSSVTTRRCCWESSPSQLYWSSFVSLFMKIMDLILYNKWNKNSKFWEVFVKRLQLIYSVNIDFRTVIVLGGLPRWLSVKNPPANAGDAGSIPGSGRSPVGRHGNPFWYSCLENFMDRGARRATVHGVWQRVRRNWARTHALLWVLEKNSEQNRPSLSIFYWEKTVQE